MIRKKESTQTNGLDKIYILSIFLFLLSSSLPRIHFPVSWESWCISIRFGSFNRMLLCFYFDVLCALNEIADHIFRFSRFMTLIWNNILCSIQFVFTIETNSIQTENQKTITVNINIRIFLHITNHIDLTHRVTTFYTTSPFKTIYLNQAWFFFSLIFSHHHFYTDRIISTTELHIQKYTHTHL